MQELRIFENSEFGELGVLEIEGKMYFPATRCAKMLGYENPNKAIIDHCKRDGVTKREGVSVTTNQYGTTTQQVMTMNYITEGNLYRLIAGSRLPAAERFERWVFDEVLPTIRRTGGYAGDISAMIVQAVQATVRELMPYMMGKQAPEPIQRKRRRTPSIMEALDAEIRQEAEDMLQSRSYTYSDIRAHLWESYGVRVSNSSFGRWALRVQDRLEEIGE